MKHTDTKNQLNADNAFWVIGGDRMGVMTGVPVSIEIIIAGQSLAH